MKRLFYAALAVAVAMLSPALHAVPVSCERTDTVDGGVTLVCKGVSVTPAPKPPAPPADPVTPTPPPPPVVASDTCPPNIASNWMLCSLWLSNPVNQAPSPPAPSGGGGSYEGFELSPGHPRVNMLSAEGVYAFYFQSTGATSAVGYGTASGTDSGMRVTSWISDAANHVVVEPETRVVANWQPFPVTLPPGRYRLYVQPHGTGPLMVEQQ